jgi:thymidylate synthase
MKMSIKHYFEADNTCDLSKMNIENILKNGKRVNREVGEWCLKERCAAPVWETYGTTFKLTEPFNCVTSQHCLAAEIETEDYILGLNPGFVHYSDWSFYKKWLLGGEKYSYTYGSRGGVWLLYVIKKLQDEPTSRQIVVNIWEKRNDLSSKKFVPCGTQWVFMTRDDGDDRLLDMYVTIRSQDACRGFFLDTFAYPFIQQYVAKQSDLVVGEYYHILINSHIYEDDMEFAKSLLKHTINQGSVIIYDKLTERQRGMMFEASEKMFIEKKVHWAGQHVRKLPQFWKEWKQNQVIYAYTKYIKGDPMPTALTCTGVVINVLPKKD